MVEFMVEYVERYVFFAARFAAIILESLEERGKHGLQQVVLALIVIIHIAYCYSGFVGYVLYGRMSHTVFHELAACNDEYPVAYLVFLYLHRFVAFSEQ